MTKILIIQTSLNKKSKTALTSKKCFEIGKNKNLDIQHLDLRDYKLELCNGEKIENYNQDMNKIKEIVEAADSYILAYPIYNYSFSGVAKNFLDIFSKYMENKKCGIIQNGYSVRSFGDGFGELTRVLGLHNNISTVLPIVHTYNEDFENDTLIGVKSIEKMETLLSNL